MNGNCKGCDTTVYIDDEEMEQLLKNMIKRGHEVVDDVIYQERLSACYSCDQYAFDSTCKVCGCFVKFRAKLANKKCPNSSGTRWEK